MKTLQELTLLDKFLFDQVMDCADAHEAVLQIILGQEELSLLTPSQTEKELRTTPWLRSIRLDVYALDKDSTVYNTEMQAEPRSDLIRRSRYYQSLIDTSLLEPGTVSFNRLNNTCIIIITPFDLFGEGRYCYTFRAKCDENTELNLNDGAVRIFLNTRGTNDNEVRPELVDFLHYVETVDGKLAANSGSERIECLHACVSRIKASEEIGVKYMQRWEERIYDREDGHLQAKLEDIRQLMANLEWAPEQAMRALGIPEEKHSEFLQKLKDSQA